MNAVAPDDAAGGNAKPSPLPPLPRAASSNRRPTRLPLLGFAAWLWLGWAPASPPCLAQDPPTLQPFLVGFSINMFVEVNETDARAAIKGWANTVARQLDVPFNPEPLVFANLTQAAEAIRTQKVDALALTFAEFDSLRSITEFSPVFATRIGQRLHERYVVYARRDGPIQDLASLRGRHLACLTSVRTSLGPTWLAYELARSGLPSAIDHTRKIDRPTKLSKAVLPVFFRQADACLVTESGFTIMADLNPQIGKDLVPIASSPEILPAVFALRADFKPQYHERLIRGLRDMNTTPAGQQVLTVFHGDALVEMAPNQLQNHLDQLATFRNSLPLATPSPESPPR